MEKYGVVTEVDDIMEKQSGSGGKPCPSCPCGEPLEKTSGSPKCPKHGTQPFEKKEKK
jgi:hypothetical protein